MKKTTLVSALLAASLLDSCCLPYLRLNTAGALDNIGKTVHVTKPGIKGYYKLDGETYALIDTYRAHANESIVEVDQTCPIHKKADRRYSLIDAQPEPWLIALGDGKDTPAAAFDFSAAKPCTIEAPGKDAATALEPEAKVFRHIASPPHPSTTLVPEHYIELDYLPCEYTGLNYSLDIVKFPLLFLDFGVTVTSCLVTQVGAVTLLPAATVVLYPIHEAADAFDSSGNKEAPATPAE